MHPEIARLLFRLQEKLLSRDSFAVLSELRRSETWSRQDLHSLQLSRLKTTLRLAYQHTPYWRRLMDDFDIHPGDIHSLSDLKNFPSLCKRLIRLQREKMVWKEASARVQLVRTSGSTNEALEFYTSASREAHINAARMRGHEWVGIRRGEKELYYWGSPIELNKQDRVKRLRDWLINDGLTNGFEITPQRLRDNFEFWLKWQPRCMFGYVSTFVLTVMMGQALGIDLRELKSRGLKVIVTTSELLSDVDRKLISDAFGVPVYDSYGLREAGLISHECEYGTMHCTDEQIILETVDPKTHEPVDGEGELVVTNLVGHAFPVIRYATGDIVTLSQELCACGRTLSQVKISGGRAVEFIVTKAGKWVGGVTFMYVARAIPGIVKFQAYQEQIGEIVFRLVVDQQFPDDGVEEVLRQVQQRIEGDDRIIVEIVEDIKPAPSGKYRPVISKVALEMFRNRDFSA